MKAIRTAIACSVLMAAGFSDARAHPGGHGDEPLPFVIGDDTAKQIAQAEVTRLVDSEKIEESWRLGEFQALERVYRQGELQWLATFHNKAAKAAKELFVVVTTGGDVSAGGLAIEAKAAKARARKELRQLTASGQIPSSWRDADPTKIEKRPEGSHWQWVATFDDQAQPDQKQVFIFLLPHGEFVATNFSGR